MRSAARLLRLTLRSTFALLIATHAHAATLYAVGGNTQPSGGQSALYTVNKTTAVHTWIGSLGTPFNYDNSIYNGGIAYDPYTDRTYAIGCDSTQSSALFLVDRATAQVTRIGLMNGPSSQSFCSGGIAFDVFTQKLYAVGDIGSPIQSTALVEVNTTTGGITPIGGSGTPGTYLYGLGSDPATGILYANGFANFNSQSLLFVVDKGSGTATIVGSHGLPFGRQMTYSGLAIDPATGVMYGFGSVSASQSGLFAVSKNSGAASLVATMTPSIGVDGAPVFIGADVLGVGNPAGSATITLLAWPSPSRGPVSIAFVLPSAMDVTLTVHDVAGRRIALLVDRRLESGRHEVRWDGRDAAGEPATGGVYFATLRGGGGRLGHTTVMMTR